MVPWEKERFNIVYDSLELGGSTVDKNVVPKERQV